MIDYTNYLPELRATPLFRDMSEEEILVVLNAMQPPFKEGRPTPPQKGKCHEGFRMVIRSTSSRPLAPQRFKYAMPGFGEPGMLMGEVLALSRKEEFVRPTPLNIKPPLPEIDFDMETLEFTPEMITRYYSAHIAPAQGKMLRNLLGMLAQKIVDIRRELYLERSGYDIYAEKNLISHDPLAPHDSKDLEDNKAGI